MVIHVLSHFYISLCPSVCLSGCSSDWLVGFLKKSQDPNGVKGQIAQIEDEDDDGEDQYNSWTQTGSTWEKAGASVGWGDAHLHYGR